MNASFSNAICDIYYTMLIPSYYFHSSWFSHHPIAPHPHNQITSLPSGNKPAAQAYPMDNHPVVMEADKKALEVLLYCSMTGEESAARKAYQCNRVPEEAEEGAMVSEVVLLSARVPAGAVQEESDLEGVEGEILVEGVVVLLAAGDMMWVNVSEVTSDLPWGNRIVLCIDMLQNTREPVLDLEVADSSLWRQR